MIFGDDIILMEKKTNHLMIHSKHFLQDFTHPTNKSPQIERQKYHPLLNHHDKGQIQAINDNTYLLTLPKRHYSSNSLAICKPLNLKHRL